MSRVRLLWPVVICFDIFIFRLCMMVPAAGAADNKNVVALSNHPQLFLDDHLVARMHGLTRAMQRPARHPDNPVLTREYPWEKRTLQIYGTVLYEPELKKFRMWYVGSEHPDAVPEYYICYAESTDGINWTKPLVGTAKMPPHEKHNMVIPGGHGICVMRAREPSDPGKRYVAAGGATLAYSPDGIHWTMRHWGAPKKNDTGTSVVWWKGEYLAFVRYQVRDPQWPGVMRGVGLCRSNDFENWTSKTLVFTTDKQDGYPWTQPYGLCVTAYGDVLIGLLPLLHLNEKPGNNSLGDMDVQLLVSRDGRRWQRVARRAVLMKQSSTEPVERRAWDMRPYPGTTMLVKDNKIYIYYTGSNGRHGEGKASPAPKFRFNSGIGLATLPADRFVALSPSRPEEEGILQTKPLKLSGRQLLVNAQLAKVNDLKVELLDGQGNVLPGYDRGRSRLAAVDKLRYRVQWESNGQQASLKKVAGKQPIALRFILRRGSLFAFQVVDR